MARRKRPILACCVQFDSAIKNTALSAADVPEIAARAGVDGVEFREVYWKDKAAELPAARDAMARLGLRPTYATFTTLLNEDADARERLLGDIEDARALGASLLRVFRGPWPAGGDEVAMWRGARQAIALATTHGIRLALENFVKVPGNRRVEIETALLAFDSPTLGTNIDTANYVGNGEDLLANVEALSEYICYSHLKDVRFDGDQTTVVALGEGSLPFDRIFDLFDATGRDFPVTFEFPGGDDPERTIARSLEHLRRLGLPA